MYVIGSFSAIYWTLDHFKHLLYGRFSFVLAIFPSSWITTVRKEPSREKILLRGLAPPKPSCFTRGRHRTCGSTAIYSLCMITYNLVTSPTSLSPGDGGTKGERGILRQSHNHKHPFNQTIHVFVGGIFHLYYTPPIQPIEKGIQWIVWQLIFIIFLILICLIYVHYIICYAEASNERIIISIVDLWYRNWMRFSKQPL